MKRIKVISCIATIGIMALIFWFSSQDSDESSEVSNWCSRFIIDLIPSLSGLEDAAKADMADSINYVIRKLAHFSIYAMLGMSSAAAFSSLTGKRIKRILILSVPFCGAYAVSDEIHQTFVSGRAGMPTDVLIDSLGAFTGGLLLMLVVNIYEQIRKKKVNQ